MSWNDFYRRRDILDAVLRQARHDPEAALPISEIPGAEEAFGDESGLLLALHYKWSQLLSGYLRAELLADTDHVDAVTKAWQAAVADHRTLREVLDANLGRHRQLRPAHEAEQRMLAVSAGLADASEPAEELTKIGAALEALLRESDAQPRKRPAKACNRVGSLLRMLAPST